MSKSNSSTRGDSLDNPGEYEVEIGSPTENCTEMTDATDVYPSSPPPSYEHVLEETRLQAQKEESTPTDSNKGPVFHKSSKELYKAVAKQFGITCKMSDQCRCLDCQSNYFDCEYDQTENEKI